MNLFLSHATLDAELVEDVRSRMQAIGVSVYTAEHDQRAGENLHAKIAAEIDKCHAMAVLLTKAGYNSNYVNQEIGYALRARKLVVPLVTSESVRSGMSMLEGVEYIVVDEHDPADALHKLSERIEQLSHERQQHQEDLLLAALMVVTVGVLILAIREAN